MNFKGFDGRGWREVDMTMKLTVNHRLLHFSLTSKLIQAFFTTLSKLDLWQKQQ